MVLMGLKRKRVEGEVRDEEMRLKLWVGFFFPCDFTCVRALVRLPARLDMSDEQIGIALAFCFLDHWSIGLERECSTTRVFTILDRSTEEDRRLEPESRGSLQVTLLLLNSKDASFGATPLMHGRS